MAKFKADIPKSCRKELESFLEPIKMTPAEFLQLAIRAKEFLVSNSILQQAHRNAMSEEIKTLPKKRKVAHKKVSLSRLPFSSALPTPENYHPSVTNKSQEPESQTAKKSAKPKMKANSKSGTTKAGEKAKASKVGKTSSSKSVQASFSAEDFQRYNRKLYDKFATYARSQDITYKECASQLGFSLRQLQRIRFYRSPKVVSKLEDALKDVL